MTQENKLLTLPLLFMKHLNFIVILYIGMTTIFCIDGIVKNMDAFLLLENISLLPGGSSMILVTGAGYYICLLLVMSIHTSKNLTLYLKLISEILLGIMICSSLHFSYLGVILLIMADGLQYVPDMKRRYVIISAVGILYLILDSTIISGFVSFLPLNQVWFQYDSTFSLWMTITLRVFTIINLFAFILYMVILFLNQMSEKQRILLLNQELEEKNQQLLIYAKEMETVTQTRERNRLAREIHDALGHSLTGIITGIDACIMIMDVAPEATKEQLKAIADVARKGIKDVRRSINALRPDALETIHLKAAIEQMIYEMAQSTGVRIGFHCNVSIDSFSQDEEDVIYHIIQESITNAIRHGKATRINITIEMEYQILTIHIVDNGIGCKTVKKGFGLHHMKERLEMLNGHLEYDGSDGFFIKATIPIRWGGGLQ